MERGGDKTERGEDKTERRVDETERGGDKTERDGSETERDGSETKRPRGSMDLMAYHLSVRPCLRRLILWFVLAFVLSSISIVIGALLKPDRQAVIGWTNGTLQYDVASQTGITAISVYSPARDHFILRQHGMPEDGMRITTLPRWVSPPAPVAPDTLDRYRYRDLVMAGLGWPFVSWVQITIGDIVVGQPTNVMLLPEVPLPPLEQETRIYWPGLFGNLAFYTIIIAGLHMGFLGVRSRRRKLRGMCPRCAYDLRGGRMSETSGETSGVCPECGEVVGGAGDDRGGA